MIVFEKVLYIEKTIKINDEKFLKWIGNADIYKSISLKRLVDVYSELCEYDCEIILKENFDKITDYNLEIDIDHAVNNQLRNILNRKGIVYHNVQLPNLI